MHGLRSRRQRRQRRAEGARADLSQAGLGRARCDRDLGAHPGGRRRGHGLGRRDRRRRRGRRDHEPARDRGRVGQDDRPADPQRARLAGHPHGQAGRRVLEGRRPGPLPGEGRASARDLLLGAEDPLDPRQRRRRRREGRLRRPAVRQHGHLDHLEPHGRHGRRAAHHRRDEREPHDADGPALAVVGRRGHGRDGDPGGDAARDPRLVRRLRRGPRGRRAPGRADRRRPRAISRRPRSARPASRPARPRTRTAPATSCCSTRARRRSRRRTAC